MPSSFADGLSLISRGSGQPALVFLHYFSGAAASWQWVVEILQHDFQCIALDLPGFGQAEPLAETSLAGYSQFISKALTQLQLERVVLVGHSMGGKLALQVAADLGEGILERVILVAPSPPTQEPMPDEEKERMLGNHHQRQVATTTVDSASQQALPTARRELAIDTHIQAEDSTWRWWLLEGMNHSIADRLDQISVPVRVIASPDDPVIPWKTVEQEVMALLPEAKLIKLSGVGHLVPLENPEQLAAALRQALVA